jgi:hypothetical protein
MRVKVLGKVWTLRTVPRLAARGDCDAPTDRRKEIRIRAGLRGEERLEVLLHELLHAAGWHLDEPFVEQFSADAARALRRLGYRLEGGSQHVPDA